MILAKLMGGLGNQMAQYALARHLALKHHAEVVFDCSYFSDTPPGDTPRRYELGHLAVHGRMATREEIGRLSGQGGSLWSRLLRKTGLQNPSVFFEPPGRFCPEVLDLPDNSYLVGYWLSEGYFAEIADLLREELRVAAPLTGRNLELSRKILEVEAVAVHVRRGDYVSSPKTTAFHGILGQDYYEQGIMLLRQRVANPYLFIFSDDPQWVRSNLNLSVPCEVVAHNPPEQGHEDLRLMSLCKHAIIANSSFSWWGAWLNENPAKFVIAPRRWFSDPSIDTSYLIPPAWERI